MGICCVGSHRESILELFQKLDETKFIFIVENQIAIKNSKPNEKDYSRINEPINFV